MANTRYIAVRPLEPGKPVDVLERDEAGALVGAWHGYWSYKRGTVALYPNPKNRFVSWPGGVLPRKRIVSDRVILVLDRKNDNPPGAKAVSLSSNKGSSGDTGVQERIKFD